MIGKYDGKVNEQPINFSLILAEKSPAECRLGTKEIDLMDTLGLAVIELGQTALAGFAEPVIQVHTGLQHGPADHPGTYEYEGDDWKTLTELLLSL